ncbi:hypothetical protein ACEPAF_565 [Sanghuangporus sanghuang]
MSDAICTASSTEAFFYVAAPFTTNENADVILRTSNGFDFYVVRAVLSRPSPVFKDMSSSIPQPPMLLDKT